MGRTQTQDRAKAYLFLIVLQGALRVNGYSLNHQGLFHRNQDFRSLTSKLKFPRSRQYYSLKCGDDHYQKATLNNCSSSSVRPRKTSNKSIFGQNFSFALLMKGGKRWRTKSAVLGSFSSNNGAVDAINGDISELRAQNDELNKLLHELQEENALLKEANEQLMQKKEGLKPKVILESFEGEGSLFMRREFDETENAFETAVMFEPEVAVAATVLSNGTFEEEVLPPASTAAQTQGPIMSEKIDKVEDEEWCDEIDVVDGSCIIEPGVSFREALKDRALWLVGLLIMQSCSGFILARNEALLQDHPIIVYFLTMLVGAGGNAGNQASVRVIRGLALGSVNEKTQYQFLTREVKMAIALSFIVSSAGFMRAKFFRTPFPETIAVTSALFFIVFSSICLGAVLPLILKKFRIDPAHSSTTIQVIMDILGVVLTVFFSETILDSALGKFLISKLTVT